MRVVLTVVGLDDVPRTAEWPEGWPVPREGDAVAVHGHHLRVRTVEWYPQGEDGDEPFVLIAVGKQRP